MRIKLTEAEYSKAFQRANDIDRRRRLVVDDRVCHVNDSLVNMPLLKIEGRLGLVRKDGRLVWYPLQELISTTTLTACIGLAQMLKFMKRKKRTKGAMFVFQF